MAASDAGRPVPVHGDFYEANVLMEGESVTSLLDVDSLGPGYRVDDLACLLGHVSVLDHLAPASYPKLRPILETWTRMAERQVDPVSLRARCAGVVLSLVAGARREDGGPWRPDAEGRLARAETWLAQGREIQAAAAPTDTPAGCSARGRQKRMSDFLEMVNPRPVIVFQQVIPLDCEVQA